jgi:hypothetical protein
MVLKGSNHGCGLGLIPLVAWTGTPSTALEGCPKSPDSRAGSIIFQNLLPSVALLPTAVANVLNSGTLGQPGAYIIHPATLDAATHTAAAFSESGQEGENPPFYEPHLLSALMCKEVFALIVGISAVYPSVVELNTMVRAYCNVRFCIWLPEAIRHW